MFPKIDFLHSTLPNVTLPSETFLKNDLPHPMSLNVTLLKITLLNVTFPKIDLLHPTLPNVTHPIITRPNGTLPKIDLFQMLQMFQFQKLLGLEPRPYQKFRVQILHFLISKFQYYDFITVFLFPRYNSNS